MPYISVDYRQHQPNHHELRQRGFNQVSVPYDSDLGSMPFRPIPCCEAVPLQALQNNVKVEILKMEVETTVEEALFWIDQMGYRPALYEELLAFFPYYKSGAAGGGDVHAIGSVVATRGESYLSHAMIGRGEDLDENGNSLILACVGYHTPNAKRFNVWDNFLVVSKERSMDKKDCYRLHVSYAKLPGVAALEENFSKDDEGLYHNNRLLLVRKV